MKRQVNARATAIARLASWYSSCPFGRDARNTRDCKSDKGRVAQAAAQGGNSSEGARGQWESLSGWYQPDLDDSWSGWRRDSCSGSWSGCWGHDLGD